MINIYKNNVKCSNCGYTGLVKKCTDLCPGCGYRGWLALKIEEPKEVLL